MNMEIIWKEPTITIKFKSSCQRSLLCTTNETSAYPNFTIQGRLRKYSALVPLSFPFFFIFIFFYSETYKMSIPMGQEI